MPLWSGDLGRYVECLECGEAFHPAILNDPSRLTERDHAVFRTLMVGIMVSMMDADGVADQLELQAVAMIYSELAGGPIPPSVLQQGVDMARVAGATSAIELAGSFNPRLNQLSRELVFRSALYISAADGVIRQEEMDYLKEIGLSLGLDADHMGAIIDAAERDGHFTVGGTA